MIKSLKKIFNKIIIARPSKKLYKFMISDWIALGDLDNCKRVLETKRFNRNLKPIEIKYPKAKNIVVLAPHPDDDVIGAGGTLIKAKEHGSNIHIIYVTNGVVENSKRIKLETKSVCDEGGFIPHFLNCNPRSIPINDNTINDKLFSILKLVDPEIIFTSFLLDDHDDHRRINHLLSTQLRKNYFKKCEVWSYQIYSSIFPNVVIDITNQKDRKKELIDMWESVSKFNDLAHYILGINASNCRYLVSDYPVWVESFFVIPLNEYLEICDIYFSKDSSKNYYFNKYQKA